jgi:hypothetical protein
LCIYFIDKVRLLTWTSILWGWFSY